MNNVLLISENKLKAFTALHENIRVEDLAPYIMQAQDLYLQPVLGTKFYKAIKEKVVNQALNAKETELLEEYIAPMLIQRSFALSVPFLKYKIVDKGILSGNSETSSDTNLDEVKYIIDKIEVSAQFYQQRVREYLIDNLNEFPEYINPGVDGMLPNRKSQYTSGLTIPSLYSKYRPYYDEIDPFCFWRGPVS